MLSRSLLGCNRVFTRRNCVSAFFRSRSISDVDVSFFESILGDGGVVRDPDESYTVDWKKQYHSPSKVLLKPSSAGEVSEILSYCNEKRLSVVPQGGRTGLVGGGVGRSPDEILLSMERMNRIHSLEEGILHCESGCVLEMLQDYASSRDCLVPIDIGAKGSCQIGGNVSTNAGGVYYRRYGSIAANLLGLRVVLANGQVLDLRSHNRKDNTGLPLVQLFVGAEGTLGVITDVVISCPSAPVSRVAAWLSLSDYSDVMRIAHSAPRRLPLAAMEWMDSGIAQFLDTPGTGAHHILLETHGFDDENDTEEMLNYLERFIDDCPGFDGVVAENYSQLAAFWKLRESANPTLSKMGYGYKYDVSLPIAQFDDFVGMIRDRLEEGEVLANWGHIWDGNLHCNVVRPGEWSVNDSLKRRLEPFLYEQVLARGGSISAEHGIGQEKTAYMSRVHTEANLQAMHQLKRIWDPHNILNPGKVLIGPPS